MNHEDISPQINMYTHPKNIANRSTSLLRCKTMPSEKQSLCLLETTKESKAIKGGYHKRIGIPIKDVSILMCISF